jgi:hypothetical protein
MIRRPRVARPPPVAAEFPATVLPMTDVLRAFVKSVAAGLQLVGLLDAPAASRLPGCAGVVARLPGSVVVRGSVVGDDRQAGWRLKRWQGLAGGGGDVDARGSGGAVG